jgi:hypothetical protein
MCLVEEQSGFRPATSSDKASYRLINEMLNVMNERKVVGGIFCDLQKVFDCVNHNILLIKLEFYGVTGTIFTLIKSYLECRYQKVILDNNLPNSDWGEIRHGVPQGSIIRPLLFLLYINHLPKLVNDNAEVVLKVNDTSIIINSLNPRNVTNSANKILQDITNGSLLISCHNADKSQNADKTQYMQFVTKTTSLIDLHVMCKNKEIANTCSTKFLGLTLDSTFFWKNHKDAIVPKISSACFAVRAVKSFFIPRITEDDILLLSIHNDLWIRILGLS